MPLPPLVEPAATLPAAELERAARQWRLPEIGEIGQRRLFAARVAVLGSGGLGAPALLYLASAGVGTIGVIDFDVVEASNLQRQVLFTIDDIGKDKVTAAALRLRQLAPTADIVEHRVQITAANAAEVFTDYDLVIDGSDNFDTRYAVADACAALGIPLVWGSVLRFDAQVTVFWTRPPRGTGIGLRDVFPAAPPPGEVPTCAEAGVLGALCGQVGSLLAAEAIKLICGSGETLLGRMLVIDALSARSREIPLRAETAAGSDSSHQSEPSRVSVADLADLGPGITLFDVRAPAEFDAGSIPGAISVPLNALRESPPTVTGIAVVFCQRGSRSRVAATHLAAAHPDADIRVLTGGYEAWAQISRAHA